jgi:hypothetical protein
MERDLVPLALHQAPHHSGMDKELRTFLDDLAEGYPGYDEMDEVGVNSLGGVGPPLHYAIVGDRPEIIKLLLVYGANPNLQDGAGYTALDTAVEFERFGTIALLKSYGAHLHMIAEEDLRKAEEGP